MKVLNLTMKEPERYEVLSEIAGGYLKVKEDTEILWLTVRQVKSKGLWLGIML